jgi:hypothetical protein
MVKPCDVYIATCTVGGLGFRVQGVGFRWFRLGRDGEHLLSSLTAGFTVYGSGFRV